MSYQVLVAVVDCADKLLHRKNKDEFVYFAANKHLKKFTPPSPGGELADAQAVQMIALYLSLTIIVRP